MSSYYYLVAGLPDIALDDGKLSCTVAGFKSDIYPHLSAHDQRLVDLFYLKFDNEDLLRLLKDKEAVTEGKGNFTGEELLELVEAVRNGDRPDPKMPSYMVSFLTEYFAAEGEPYLTEDKLAAAYYHYAMGAKNPFIAAWFEFSLHVNNVLAALSARWTFRRQWSVTRLSVSSCARRTPEISDWVTRWMVSRRCSGLPRWTSWWNGRRR